MKHGNTKAIQKIKKIVRISKKGGNKLNPVFWALIIIMTVIVWFGLSILFKPFGKWLYRIMDDTREILNEEDEEEKK